MITGPLSGYRFIELAGIGPAPYAGQLLADMGAEIVLVRRPGSAMPMTADRGKIVLELDLRQAESMTIMHRLIESAHALFEGFRPGVAERLSLGPKDCHAINPALVYGRMTGWGQTGPWAKTAGHDINYIAISGALGAIGEAGTPPPPPLNLIGDFGAGSLFLVTGLLAALLKAEKTGQGDVVDAAMIDGVQSMMGIIYSLQALGQWTPNRSANLLDGGMPFYRCYATQDRKYMAVGCIEPQFFKDMLTILGIDAEAFGGQHDRSKHAEQHAMLETLFASKTRNAWSALFDGTDACVTPVLDYLEAAKHPQNAARGGMTQSGPFTHPRPAPVFESIAPQTNTNITMTANTPMAVLQSLGISTDGLA